MSDESAYALLSADVTIHHQDRLALCFFSRYDSPMLRQVLAHPDDALKDPDCEVLKSDRTTTVGVISFDGRRFVFKRYNTKNTWHALRRALRRARAENCWNFAPRLTALGIATAPVVGWVQERIAGLKSRSWILCEHVAGPTCASVLSDDSEPAVCDEILEGITGILLQLRQNRLSHGDLKATNILLVHNRPVIVDLDAVQTHISAAACERAFKRDCSRWLKNWREQPELKARAIKQLRKAGLVNGD